MTKARDLADFLGSGADIAGIITADGLTVDANSGNIELQWDAGSTHKVGSSFSTTYFTGMRVTESSRNTDIISLDASGVGNINLFTGIAETKRLSVNPSGDISFYDSLGSSQSFFWDASAESLGIGTTSPSSYGKLTLLDGATRFWITESTANEMMLSVGASERMLFGINNSEAMRIDASGRVGIGTSSPEDRLDLGNGNLRFKASLGGTGTYGSIKAFNTAAPTNPATNIRFIRDVAYFGNDGAICFDTVNTERMRIDSSGMLNAYYGISVDGGTIKLDGNYPVGTENVALGDTALDSIESGGAWNVAIGPKALTALTTGNGNTAVGRIAMESATTAIQNTALGYGTLQALTTASNNTAVGYRAGFGLTTGARNVSIGNEALEFLTTGNENIAIGVYAAESLSTGSSANIAIGYASQVAAGERFYNVTVGHSSGRALTTGSNNMASGYSALRYNTTGSYNTAVGTGALYSNTTASDNTAVGYQSLSANTTGTYNTGLGRSALAANTTGYSNTALGYLAGFNNTTGFGVLAVGREAAFNNATGANVLAVGSYAGFAATGGQNTFIGNSAGFNVTTGTGNTFIGTGVDGYYYPSGYFMTTGSNNTILGNFDGYSAGLDIRTSNNYIVLSDGAGNPRGVFNSSGQLSVATTTHFGAYINSVANGSIDAFSSYGTVTTALNQLVFRNPNGVVGTIATNGTSTSYNTSSDYRLKEDVQPMTGASDRVLALNPVNFAWKADGTRVDGFIAHEAQEVVPEAVHGEKDAVDADGNPVYQGIDQSKLVPLLTAALQEALTEIASLKARLDAANL